MLQAEIRGIYDIIAFLMPIVEALGKSCCFYRFVKPFVIPLGKMNGMCPPETLQKKKKCTFCSAAAYFVVILLFYTIRLSMNVYVIYGMASFIAYIVICNMDKSLYRQKLFLVTTFLSLSWFAAAMADILQDFLYDYALKTDYMWRHPEMSDTLYIMMSICYLAFDFSFTVIGLRTVLKVYTNKGADMGKKEVAMLTLPSLMGLIGYEIMRYYRVFYTLETGTMEKTYDSLTLLYCVISSATIIVVIMLYQSIRTKQDETRQTELLAVQINDIQRHIERTESLYRDILGIRHDMANHILTLERLYEGNKTAEARVYGKEIKAALARTTDGLKSDIRSGNPVTDVILQEYQKEAVKKEISFHSEFYYPADTSLNAFDISILLNNALQNAIENTAKNAEKERQISVISYRRNNAYIIEIRNNYTGILHWNAGNGFPASSKTMPEGHGYGLPNIRRIALKYAGDIDITLMDGQFCLCIMLMLE